MIGGVKLEGSSFTGIQVLPNLRLAWQPSGKTLLWASASRAVRTPSRIDRDLTEPTILAKAPDFRSEKLIAFEGGYRGQPSRNTTLSVSFFYNLYNRHPQRPTSSVRPGCCCRSSCATTRAATPMGSRPGARSSSPTGGE